MPPDVSNLVRSVRTTRCAYSGEVRSSADMEATRVISYGDDASDVLADHVVSEEHLAKEKQPMHAEVPEKMSQATLSDAITGIIGLVEDAVTAFVTHEG